MNKVMNWLVNSSQNAGQVALTVQGVLVANASWVISNLAMFGINVSNASWLILAAHAGIIVGIVLLAFGLIRKVLLTITNKNASSSASLGASSGK